MDKAEPISAPTLLADADHALDEDDKRALSLALGYNVAVLSLPPLQTITEWSMNTLPGAPPKSTRCRIVWQADNELASITANERGEISIHVVPYLDTKTALDLAGALAAVVARIAGGDLPKPPGREN
ncbi:hypothetical protein RCF19_04035 [Rhodococcus qingshengii]